MLQRALTKNSSKTSIEPKTLLQILGFIEYSPNHNFNPNRFQKASRIVKLKFKDKGFMTVLTTFQQPLGLKILTLRLRRFNPPKN